MTPDIALAGCGTETLVVLVLGSDTFVGTSSGIVVGLPNLISGSSDVVVTAMGFSLFFADELDNANETPIPPINTVTTVPTRVKVFLLII